jgi:hypothetical protein
MSSVIISGDTSGAITLAAPAVAGTNTATLPVATGELSMLGGSGQTYQDVSASRASGTTYTNSTGKPILAIITVNQSAAFVLNYSITVSSVVLAAVNVLTPAQSTTAVIPTTFIVPNGSTYLLTITTGTLNKWVELR